MPGRDYLQTAFKYLLVSALLPTFFFALALVLSNASSYTLLSILTCSCTLPLVVHMSIYARLSAHSARSQASAQPHLYDLFWAVPAALYATTATLQRYITIALYVTTEESRHTHFRGMMGIVYMLGVMEWTTVSQLSAMLWRASREPGIRDVEKSCSINFAEIPRIVVTNLED